MFRGGVFMKPTKPTDEKIPMVQCPKCKREYPYIMLQGHGFSGLCFDCWRKQCFNEAIKDGTIRFFYMAFLIVLSMMIGVMIEKVYHL
jgi:hypothetical protein